MATDVATPLGKKGDAPCDWGEETIGPRPVDLFT